MKTGIMFANVASFGTPEGATDFATAAEAAGVESVWTVEHVIFPSGYESAYPYDDSGKMAMAPDTPLTDPLIWLTWVGARTSSLRLGTGILILPERNPVVLAKEVGTLDALSGGRVELGIGVGWLREEFDALSIPWERRGARTDEYIEVLRTLWSGNEVSFDGEFASFAAISSNPKPTNGTVPITIGGHSESAAKRAGRTGNGFFPGKGDLAEMMGTMRQAAEDAGRDPADIEVTWFDPEVLGEDPVGAAERLREAGVTRFAVPSIMFMRDPATSLEEFGERVVGPIAGV
ncbi:MAG: LLM class F420-dependent oxidoreductase [Actinomycetota bacterium]|nr:LLM class F420-dependent oxidoreductase [Actinomycetota bacterium]